MSKNNDKARLSAGAGTVRSVFFLGGRLKIVLHNEDTDTSTILEVEDLKGRTIAFTGVFREASFRTDPDGEEDRDRVHYDCDSLRILR